MDYKKRENFYTVKEVVEHNTSKDILKEESDVLKKDIAFHFFLPHMESVKNKLSENSLEEILYKFKAELPSEEFIKILDAFKSCGEKI